MFVIVLAALMFLLKGVISLSSDKKDFISLIFSSIVIIAYIWFSLVDKRITLKTLNILKENFSVLLLKGYFIGLIVTAALFGFNYTILYSIFFKVDGYYYKGVFIEYYGEEYKDNQSNILLMSICLTIVMVFLWIRLSKKRSI
jgi:hypothetical protein